MSEISFPKRDNEAEELLAKLSITEVVKINKRKYESISQDLSEKAEEEKNSILENDAKEKSSRLKKQKLNWIFVRISLYFFNIVQITYQNNEEADKYFAQYITLHQLNMNVFKTNSQGAKTNWKIYKCTGCNFQLKLEFQTQKTLFSSNQNSDL